MKHDDYMKKFENDPEYLKGVIDMLEKDNLRLQKAVDEARNILMATSTYKGEKYSYMVTVSKDWLAANPKESE